MSEPIQRIKACLNGGRSRAGHAGVPVRPDELAASAAAAVAAGAEAVHLHPRGRDGRESLQAADVGAAVAAVRAACPGVPAGVSTGVWITGGDVAGRLAAVAGWAALAPAARPDFASVNIGEPGWAELAAGLDAAGIGAEAGVWTPADARELAAGPPRAWLRVLVEIMGGPAAAAGGSADEILGLLDAGQVRGPRLLHGEGPAAWPLVARAGQLGLPTRAGLEDMLAGPDGSPAAGNAELVRAALAIWSGQDRAG